MITVRASKILVIKLRYIGDVLLATPVLRALREALAGADITMMVNRGTEEILDHNPDLDRVMVVERGGVWAPVKLLAEVRTRRFDLVIDLTDGDRSAIITSASGAERRIGFNAERRWRGALYTDIVPESGSLHRMDRDLLALRSLGLEPKPSPPILHTTSDEEMAAAGVLEAMGVKPANGGRLAPLVMLHPGARYWFKAWPVERYAELADRLTDAYRCNVLIGGGSQESAAAEAIRRAARTSPGMLAGRVTLRQFAAILKRCALFVGNDNGAMHMAAAVGTPVIGLFGPSNPAEWGPRGDRVRTFYKGMDCRACFQPTCRQGEQNCMRQITVDEVFEAAGTWLKG